MNQKKHHLDFLDGLRGFAILWVFAYHCLRPPFGYDQLPWKGSFRDLSHSHLFDLFLPVTFGWAGVAVFFVVSGFCIHLSFLKSEPKSWRSFFARRFFRIYPPYFAVLLFFALLFPSTRLHFATSQDWIQLGSHVVMSHNLGANTNFGINGSFWSLALEVQLYLLYPVLLALVKRLGWQRSLWLLGVLEVFLRLLPKLFFKATHTALPFFISALPLNYWFSWAIGAVLADAYFNQRALPFKAAPPTVWLALAVLTYWFSATFALSFLFFALWTAALMARLLQSETSVWASPPLEPLRLLGLWSYSFYLLHQPIVNSVGNLLQKWGVTGLHPLLIYGLCCATFPLVLGISGLFYCYCELPSAKIGKRFSISRISP